jgi:hypothetical protein
MLDNFNLDIEQRALRDGGLIEAIVNLCEEKGIVDFEDVVEQLHPIVLDKLKAEYYTKNYFPDKKIENNLKDFF